MSESKWCERCGRKLTSTTGGFEVCYCKGAETPASELGEKLTLTSIVGHLNKRLEAVEGEIAGISARLDAHLEAVAPPPEPPHSIGGVIGRIDEKMVTVPQAETPDLPIEDYRAAEYLHHLKEGYEAHADSQSEVINELREELATLKAAITKVIDQACTADGKYLSVPIDTIRALCPLVQCVTDVTQGIEPQKPTVLLEWTGQGDNATKIRLVSNGNVEHNFGGSWEDMGGSIAQSTVNALRAANLLRLPGDADPVREAVAGMVQCLTDLKDKGCLGPVPWSNVYDALEAYRKATEGKVRDERGTVAEGLQANIDALRAANLLRLPGDSDPVREALEARLKQSQQSELTYQQRAYEAEAQLAAADKKLIDSCTARSVLCNKLATIKEAAVLAGRFLTDICVDACEGKETWRDAPKVLAQMDALIEGK